MNPDIAMQRIKKIFKDNTFARKTLATTGKLCFDRLTHYKTSKLLFTEPTEKQGKNYNVELLIDASGSMRGSKMRLAMEAGEAIAKTLGKYCNLNITLFNYLEKNVNWREFKADIYNNGDNEDIYPYITNKTIQGKTHIVASKERTTRHSCGGNWEISNILNAHDRLKNKSGRKIILVLLDGRPSLDYHHCGDGDRPEIYVNGRYFPAMPENYRPIVDKLSKDTLIIGFGIQTSSPSQFFENYYDINTSEDTLPQLLAALTEHIKK